MASSIELFIQYIIENPGATKYDIASALGYNSKWVNQELYSEFKKKGSKLDKDGDASSLPKWYILKLRISSGENCRRKGMRTGKMMRRRIGEGFK